MSEAKGRARSILYICDFNAHGGTQTHLLHLLASLDRRRVRPSLAALTLHPGLSARLERLDVEVANLELTGFARPSAWCRAASLAARASRGVDLIHGYLFSGNLMAAAVSRLSGVPCITSVRNLDLSHSAARRMASALAHRRARRVLFNSARVRDETRTCERIALSRTVVIPNGVPDVADTARGESGTPRAAGLTVLCVASLRAKKDHETLLEAFQGARASAPDARLLLVGEGPLRAALQASAGRRGLGDAVVFAGYQADVAAHLSRADVFVLASREEGMPNALLEAMSARLPCLVTDVGGAAEVIQDGVEGYLVPPGRPDVMAERLGRLFADPSLRRRMGEAARLRYETSFTLERMIGAYHDLYDAVLAG